jgi:predicted DNA-binding protein (UPF0251 family)
MPKLKPVKKRRTIEEKVQIVDEIKELLKGGLSLNAASQKVGISDQTYREYAKQARKFMKQNNIQRKPVQEPQTVIIPEETTQTIFFMGPSRDLDRILSTLKR